MKNVYVIMILVIISIKMVNGQNKDLIVGKIPIELINNTTVLVKAKVNNHEEITFYFDTGATSTLIDKNIAKDLNIKPNYTDEVSGAGGNIKYEIALNQRVDFDGIKIDSVDIVLNDLTRLKKSIGCDFDGIIGYSLIKDYITEIDFDSKVINLYPKNAILDFTGYKKLPFEFKNEIEIPQFDIEIELRNKEKLRGTVFFDSGAGLSLLVNTPFKEKNGIVRKSKNILTSYTNNLSKKSKVERISIEELNFAGYKFKDLSIGLASDLSGVSSFKNYLGILGAKIINRFNIILDYDNKIIYLKPNDLFKNPFEITLTGFILKKNDNNEILISKISKESPAYMKGIRENDVVVSLNGNDSQNLNEYKRLLKLKGKEIQITIKREGVLKVIRIRLKELL